MQKPRQIFVRIGPVGWVWGSNHWMMRLYGVWVYTTFIGVAVPRRDSPVIYEFSEIRPRKEKKMPPRRDDTDEQMLRAKIMKAIEACEDKSLQIVHLLMLEVLDSIGRKIDTVLKDEEAFRQMVLNGDAGTHTQDHRDWRGFKEEWDELQPAVTLMRDRHAHGGHCDWATMKMKEEADAKESSRQIKVNWASNALWGITMFIVGLVLAQFLTSGAP